MDFCLCARERKGKGRRKGNNRDEAIQWNDNPHTSLYVYVCVYEQDRDKKLETEIERLRWWPEVREMIKSVNDEEGNHYYRFLQM